MDGTKEMGGLRNVSSHCSISELDDYDLSKLHDRPKLNIERQRSFDERSLSELSIGLSRAGLDNYDSSFSPCGRSGFDTPASSTRNSFEPHPMVAEAWEALRRSLVHFRGQPVGTIAAYDHASEEVLNYDQVNFDHFFQVPKYYDHSFHGSVQYVIVSLFCKTKCLANAWVPKLKEVVNLMIEKKLQISVVL